MLKKLVCLALALPLSAGFVLAGEGHHFGKWPAISAAVDHVDQKGLDVGRSDFLLEIWFKPLPPLKAKHTSAPNTLISKKGPASLMGYDLSYYADGRLEFALCDRRNRLDADILLRAEGAVRVGRWCYAAACVSRREKRVGLYVDGKLAAEKRGAEIGDLANGEPFCIGYNQYARHGQAHCRIRQLRVWRFASALPDETGKAVAAHAAAPEKLSPVLTRSAGVRYSRWLFSDEGETVPDLGTNGNTLYYSPLSYKPRPVTEPPRAISGKTYTVDQKHPNASDAGLGTRAKPFRTIRAALKAVEPGDGVHVRSGVYREAVLVPSGLPGKPVTLEGEEGTVLSGSDPLGGWQKQGKLWIVRNWKGAYHGPLMPAKDDARAWPANQLFVNGEPMDWAAGSGDLEPGSWTIKRAAGRAGRTILLFPPPGIDPNRADVEISVRGTLVEGGSFVRVRGLTLARATESAVRVCGRGWIVEDNRIEWSSWYGFTVTGQDHVIRNNSILWCGNSGLGGRSIRLRFENNRLSYNAWRKFNPNWHGGAIKLIPGNMQHVIRGNIICYNNIATIWYDWMNFDNLIEKNVCHDNATHGGLFDEAGVKSTWRDNLCYNNVGHGINVGESKADTFQRNIVFNNSGQGLHMRGANNARAITDAEQVAALAEPLMAKLDVRRYQGMISYEGEKRFREWILKYYCRYESVRGTTRHNRMIDNAIIMPGRELLGQALRYGSGVPVDKDAENTYARNFYWPGRPHKLFVNGEATISLAAWQKVSGQDAGSVVANPWDSPEKAPAWFRERFRFKRDEFRPIWEAQKFLKDSGGGIATRVLLARLIRSKKIRECEFADSRLRGVYFEMEGKRAVALWRKGGAALTEWLTKDDEILFESRWLKRRKLKTVDGRFRLLLKSEPVTLIGITGDLAEDNSVTVEVAPWNVPGKDVPVTIGLFNPEGESREFDLQLAAPAGWKVSGGKIAVRLRPESSRAIRVQLTPPADLRSGTFQVSVSGTAGGRQVERSAPFALGRRKVVRAARHRGLKMDGDLADWPEAVISRPDGIADTRDKVLAVRRGARWGGPSDLSAKAFLMWERHNNFYLAVEVTDDRLAVKSGAKDPAQGDSVELFMDVRPAWKHFMDEYSRGAFHLIVVPGEDGKSQAFVKHVGAAFCRVYGVASRKTANGYTVEMMLHIRSGNMPEPWKVGRAIRLGMLINDSDDPGAVARKTQMGLWRTASDAPRSCSSWTAWVLGE